MANLEFPESTSAATASPRSSNDYSLGPSGSPLQESTSAATASPRSSNDYSLGPSGSPLQDKLITDDHLPENKPLCSKRGLTLSADGISDEIRGKSCVGNNNCLPGKGNTTIWARYFQENSYAKSACDTRVTRPTGHVDGKKKFYYITSHIFLSTAGHRALNMACAAQLRHICRLHNRSEAQPITLHQLVKAFQKRPEMGSLWYKVTGGSIGSALLLVTRVPDGSGVLSTVRKENKKDGRFVVEFSNEDGDGSGYDGYASTVLEKLSDRSTTEEARTKVIEAFQKAARLDEHTGGFVLLFEGSLDSPWSLGRHTKLIGQVKKDKSRI